MFKKDRIRFFNNLKIHKDIFSKFLLVGMSIFMLLLANTVSSQSQNASPQELKQPMVSHILSSVFVTRSNKNIPVEEGQFLALDDTVRTGEDSVLRILFPDGTTETLCENTTYRVQKSGSEIYEDDDANRRENIISALTRCNIRPRFIERCRSDTGFISRYTKAGERGKVGGQSQLPESLPESQVTEGQALNNNIEVDDKPRLQGLNNSSRCTTGEQLFTNYVFIPQSTIETPVVSPRVPQPPQTPVTVPESGGSPVK